jgi:hypothetical protein
MTRRIRFSGDKPPSRLRFCRHAYGPFELSGFVQFWRERYSVSERRANAKNSALATITVSPARSRRASDKCDEHAAPHCLHRMQQNRPKADIRWVSRRTVNDVTDPSLESRNRGQKPPREPAADCCTAFRKRSRYSSSRLSPSRLVYSQPLFVEIHSDCRRRTVEKPAR